MLHIREILSGTKRLLRFIYDVYVRIASSSLGVVVLERGGEKSDRSRSVEGLKAVIWGLEKDLNVID